MLITCCRLKPVFLVSLGLSAFSPSVHLSNGPRGLVWLLMLQPPYLCEIMSNKNQYAEQQQTSHLTVGASRKFFRMHFLLPSL